MKNRIHVVFILFLFFAFIFCLNSCATNKTQNDKNNVNMNLNVNNEPNNESSISEVETNQGSFSRTDDVINKSSSPKDDNTINSSTSSDDGGMVNQNAPHTSTDNSINDTVPKNDMNETISSVSEPQAVTDEPPLELIIQEEDDSLENIEENKPSLNSAQTITESTDTAVSDLQTVNETVPITEKTMLTSPEKTLSQPETQKKDLTRPPAKEEPKPAPNGSVESTQKTESQSSLALKPMSDSQNVDKNKNDFTTTEENTIAPEYSQIFSEFPSTEPDDSKEEKVSRSVKLYVGQRLEVVYPGAGWVYLGESTAQKGIKYQQRKIQNGTSLFHFASLEPGNYILNFSHFDVFSDNFISDSILVNVEKSNTRFTNTVKAPDYKGPVNTAKKDSMENKKNTENKPKMDTSISSKPISGDLLKKDSEVKDEASNAKVYDSSNLLTLTDEPKSEKEKLDFQPAPEFLDKIRGFISEGNALDALNSLDNFLKNHSSNIDEALFLRGQAYELNSPNKNVKKALEAYQTLTKAYPDSKFWDKAEARIRYIKKFYININ